MILLYYNTGKLSIITNKKGAIKMQSNNTKYSAYPLITCDPYFSVWSMSSTLYSDHMRHWTGAQQSMTGIIVIDGKPKTFMGKMRHNPLCNDCGPKPIKQKNVCVTPLKTIYTFADESIELEVTFMTPLIPDDLKLLSRPVSYISYKIKSLDFKKHDCSIYMDVSALMAVNTPDESVVFSKYGNIICCGNGNKNILNQSGDNLRINWGYLHIAAPSGTLGMTDDFGKVEYYRQQYIPDRNFYGKEIKVSDEYPVLYYANKYEIEKNEVTDFFCVAYNDIHSLEYFGKKIDAYYKKDGETFIEILQEAIDNYNEILQKVDEFDNKLLKMANEISGDYAKLVSVAYRQVIAAHKLAWDGEEAVFVSKECFSNGCAATVDVTYPSIPLFLIFNPSMVEYMLNPIFKMIDKGLWKFEFAPHDAGQYPLVNGQVYGLFADNLLYDMQMPIEECGNMILCAAAACRAKNDTSYILKHFDILSQWAEYLVKFGFDPENQLCTDDFAGHLAHNANLSVKAIMGIASWGMVLKMLGKDKESEKYIGIAKEYAGKWKEIALSGNHYKLAFDKEDSWSIKYNLVWDKLFGLKIFDDDIFTDEVNYYMTKINKYGVPLDSRSDYTKSDWQMWSSILCDNKEYTNAIISAMLKMLAETPDPVPFSDWYYTSTAIQRAFQNRSVQGGLFINMLKF